jgi:hypothetical protein
MNRNSSWKKYLFWFATEHVDFRLAVHINSYNACGIKN